MPVSQLKEFLDSHNVKYVSISHSPAYFAHALGMATPNTSTSTIPPSQLSTVNSQLFLTPVPPTTLSLPSTDACRSLP